MKELSIEEKAKRYDVAIEKAKAYQGLRSEMEIIFPELKESEDERIKKRIMSALVEWSEKCGFPGDSDDMIVWLDKQGEQKPVDKVEPKFKVGDIITNGKIIGKVDENKNNKYHGWFGYDKDLSVYYADIRDVENWHLWTIQDAKDGDVLVEGSSILLFRGIGNHEYPDVIDYYAVLLSRDKFEIQSKDEYWGTVNSFKLKPATKEQRDLLFKKMHEAGYEWDAEKKELKKIEQKPIWSEEDSLMIDETIYFIDEFQKSDRCKNENDMQNSVTCKNWLKALKDRYTWKPSELDVKILEQVIDGTVNPINYHATLHAILGQLKKLREE